MRLGVDRRWRSCCPWKGSTVAIWIPERNCSPRSASQFLYTVPDLPGTRSTQAGRGMLLPSRQVHDASELTWAPAASVLVMPHMLINPQHPNPRKTGRVIRCGSQTRLDMGPHAIPRSCQLSSQASDGGSLEAKLSDRPADHPGAQTRPRGAHPLVMFQEYHRLAGVFAAYPAPLKPPQPCRDPGPGCVDHLHHHPPVALSKSPRNPGTPPAGCTTQHQAPEYLGCEPRSSDGSPPNRRADHTDHTDQATHSSR